jgi:glycerate 2-kinase
MKTDRMAQREELERIWRAGVAACDPQRVLAPQLPEPPAGRTILLAIGKAAAVMAEVAEGRWSGPLSGLAVAPHGTQARLRTVGLVTAAHPVPDEASVAAGERLLALAKEAGPDDLVLVLLSGGASALACLPAERLTLDRKRRITADLLCSGRSIADINCVRRHLSRIKGGRLGRAVQPARLVTLAISDVVGNQPENIGSGPTVADPSTIEEAAAILADDLPWSESVKLDETEKWSATYRVIASNDDALAAAAAEASRLGYQVELLGACCGEAREVAHRHAELTRKAGQRTALISGGELTVTVTGAGRGGPNQEYALALALALSDTPFAALAADTDGIDGSAPAAGAFVDDASVLRGTGADQALAKNDTARFFAALGDAFVTGPTGTNVNDLRIILVDS